MPTTPKYGFPYPVSTDAPDAPTQFRALAESVETTLSPALPAAGTTAARPSPTPAALYYTTDTNLWWQGIRVSSVNYWAPAPGTVVFHAVASSSTTSVPSGVPTPLPFNEVIDLLNCFTNGATAYTPLVPGVYLLSGGGSFSVDTTGDYRSLSWAVDGTAVNGGAVSFLHSAISRFPIYPARTVAVRLTGSNAVSFRQQHNASGALTLGAGANIPSMTVTYAGQ